MEVLILSKTEYGTTQYCIGGIVINTHEFIRLLEPGGYYQPRNTGLKIGDIWDINFRRAAATREPHNEDVIITSKTYVRKIYGLKTYINNLGVTIWRGNITNAFDGYLRWAGSGSGFLSESQPTLPEHSVGFWVPDSDLTYQGGYYTVNGKRLPYKGTETPKPVIPRGSLIRLSLAKWWCPDNFYESRCYLQLSGWYEDQPEPAPAPSITAGTSNRPTQPIRSATTSTYSPTSSPTRPSYSGSNNKNTSGGCYIATVCYENYYADEVCTFRDFRDHTLLKSVCGKWFVKNYYLYAPRISNSLKNRKTINLLIKKIFLDPLFKIIKSSGLDR